MDWTLCREKPDAGHCRHNAVGRIDVGVYASRDDDGDDGSSHAGSFARARHAGVKTPDADVFRRVSGHDDNDYWCAAFLLASTTLQQSGRNGLGIFSIAPIGIALSLVGTLFVLFVGRYLLPSHRAEEDRANHFRLEDYLTEVAVTEKSALLERTVAELEDDERYHFKVVGLLRGGRRLRIPYKQEQLKEGDVLIVRTTPDELIAIREEPNLQLHPVKEYGDKIEQKKTSDDNAAEEDQFVQAVVAPRSELIGRTLSKINFQRRYGAIVVGLWRKDGWLDQEISKVRLQANDVLVLEGNAESLANVANDAAFLMLVPFHGESKPRRRAWLAGLIMLATILLAAFNLMTIEMAAITGAVAVVLTGCISIRQAYSSIEARIFVFIAGAIPLGVAMQKTGTANTWRDGCNTGWAGGLNA